MLLANSLRVIFGALFVAASAFACGKPSPVSSTDSDANKQEQTVVRVTGIPDENPTELQRKYRVLENYLSARLQAKVTYIPVTDYGAAVQALTANKVDFAWLGGFTHVQARVMTEVAPLVMRAIDRDFRSVFIAHRDSGVSNISDMKGKKFAFGSKSSTSGHLMPRHFLYAMFDITPEKDFMGEPVFSGAHDATAKIVESGQVAAGVLNQQVWHRLVSSKRVDSTKVVAIWTTPGYVDYVWTARLSIDSVLRDRFAKAFLALDHRNPHHRKVLDLQGARKFVRAHSGDFDAIETVARSTGLLK